MGDKFLLSVISKYVIDIERTKVACQSLYPLIKKWGGEYLVKAEYSGSLSKGTAISIGTDADIFISVSSKTPGNLADLYGTLYNAVSNGGYEVRKQNVSIGTTANDCKIDLVPGRRQSQYGNNHSLYKNKTDSWTMTNIHTHIKYVKESKRLDEIKLAKIWRQLHNLEFPSFYLEMVVIDALKYSSIGAVADNFHRVLEFFRDNLQTSTYVDPANTNNIISDDLNSGQKMLISNQAKMSCKEKYWRGVVW